MPCKKITVEEYRSLLDTDPNPTGYEDLGLCTCACDIPPSLAVSGFADNFAIYNGTYDLVRTEVYGGRTRGVWEKYDDPDGPKYKVQWYPSEYGDPAEWNFSARTSLGAQGTGQYICTGMNTPQWFTGYARAGEECVPVGGDYGAFLYSPACSVLPPNQRSYNVSISYG